MSAAVGVAKKVIDPVTGLVKDAAGAVGIGGGGGTPAAAAAPPALSPKEPGDGSVAIAANTARGRASTLAAGGDDAADTQLQRGLLKKQQRVGGAASRVLLG